MIGNSPELPQTAQGFCRTLGAGVAAKIRQIGLREREARFNPLVEDQGYGAAAQGGVALPRCHLRHRPEARRVERRLLQVVPKEETLRKSQHARNPAHPLPVGREFPGFVRRSGSRPDPDGGGKANFGEAAPAASPRQSRRIE